MSCMVFATSCTTTSLYYWGGGNSAVSKYEELAYRTYDKQTPESICNLLCVYESMVSSTQQSIRKVPAPGICAEYGYMLLSPETVEIVQTHATDQQKRVLGCWNKDIATHFMERGKYLLEQEIKLYPESKTFILPILNKMTN